MSAPPLYTVIVADDEDELREAVCTMIPWQELGFCLVGNASNGLDALQLVVKLEPDLLLTDIRMPFISGSELARQVREVRPATIIAFLSGHDDFEYAKQAIQYNIISYMLKPLTMEGLGAELQNIRRKIDAQYAMIGMAHVADVYPLYYDAVNEAGLGMAGLNFVGNAQYAEVQEGKETVAQFELIPWILGRCATVREARARLDALNLVGTPFSERYPAAQLHWLLADKDEAVVIESMADGLHVYDDPAGVLSNIPSFPQQLFILYNYLALSPRQPENRFSGALGLHSYSRGMGALGLPGDLSSMSRFVRVAYTKLNAGCRDTEAENVSQFFHILGAVEQQRGCCEVEPGAYEYTIYTSCCNAARGVYYYTTYDNHQITAVDLHRAELDGETLSTWPLVTGEQIFRQN